MLPCIPDTRSHLTRTTQWIAGTPSSEASGPLKEGHAPAPPSPGGQQRVDIGVARLLLRAEAAAGGYEHDQNSRQGSEQKGVSYAGCPFGRWTDAVLRAVPADAAPDSIALRARRLGPRRASARTPSTSRQPRTGPRTAVYVLGVLSVIFWIGESQRHSDQLALEWGFHGAVDTGRNRGRLLGGAEKAAGAPAGQLEGGLNLSR